MSAIVMLSLATCASDTHMHRLTAVLLQTLKAACDEAISVMVARGGQAGAMWERLLAAVVVMPDSQDDAAVSQYDISYQLNEIEVMPRHVSHHMWLWDHAVYAYMSHVHNAAPMFCSPGGTARHMEHGDKVLVHYHVHADCSLSSDACVYVCECMYALLVVC